MGILQVPIFIWSNCFFSKFSRLCWGLAYYPWSLFGTYIRGQMGYIGSHGVAALHRYKYSGVDHSYVAQYVLQPFWTRFVNFFPLWMPWVLLSFEWN